MLLNLERERKKRKNCSGVSANRPGNRRRVKNKRFSYLEVARFLILYINVENRMSAIIESCKMDFFQSQSLLQAHQTCAMIRPPREAHQQDALTGGFFLYLKKLKFQKYMSVLKNFKNIPRSPYGGRQG